MFYFVKTPWLIKKMYPGCQWQIEGTGKNLYLTFDDGPHPQATPFVLQELKKYDARATFFCIGKNVRDYFEIYRQILLASHKPGNHTFNHLNGWKTPDKKYLEDILQASKLIDSNLFRPPYGKITRFQLSALRGAGVNLKTIMWDVLSADFDETITPENCYLNVINNAAPGSIVTFHDSEKAFSRLEYALPRVLEYFTARGFQFKEIPDGD